MFVPPINLGQFQPSPATLADWIYQIWNYLQNNPIATQEQLQEYIATFITTSPETQELIGEGVEQYLTDNPPVAPVQSVQGKTGAVTLAFNDILKNNNTAPVYRAASMPSQSTLQSQYNLGYRLFVNTSTQEIYSITNTGGTTLVGKGKFDGTNIDVNTAEGDTTISEAVTAIEASIANINSKLSVSTITPSWASGFNQESLQCCKYGNVVTVSGFLNRTTAQTEYSWTDTITGLPKEKVACHSQIYGSNLAVVVRIADGKIQTNPRGTNTGFSGYFGLTYICE